jgi:hypothetical protein
VGKKAERTIMSVTWKSIYRNIAKKEAENLRREHKAKTVTNQTRMKSFGRFLESGGGPGGRATGRARRREIPFAKSFFLSFFLFCDRKRKKNLPFFSTFPDKHPGGVFVNISLINLKISTKLISLCQ